MVEPILPWPKSPPAPPRRTERSAPLGARGANALLKAALAAFEAGDLPTLLACVDEGLDPHLVAIPVHKDGATHSALRVAAQLGRADWIEPMRDRGFEPTGPIPLIHHACVHPEREVGAALCSAILRCYPHQLLTGSRPFLPRAAHQARHDLIEAALPTLKRALQDNPEAASDAVRQAHGIARAMAQDPASHGALVQAASLCVELLAPHLPGASSAAKLPEPTPKSEPVLADTAILPPLAPEAPQRRQPIAGMGPAPAGWSPTLGPTRLGGRR